jgi:hypothetical protein
MSTPSSRSNSRKPEWVDNKYSQYSDAKYMVEIGQGSSLKDAKRDGASALAQIFKTSIKVETSIKTRYKELASGGSSDATEETTFDQDITQLADQELVNVNFGESWTNDLGQVHVLAFIDRQVTGNIYRERIGENSKTVLNFLSRSEEQSSLIREYAYYDAAYVVAETNRVLMEQLEIISLPMARTMSIPYDLDDIRDKRKDAAFSMTFRISIENDQDGKVTSVIKDELTSFGFSIDSQGALSVTGNVSLDQIELDNNYSNIKYYLLLNIEDERGIPAVTLESNDRISAVSESAAVSRSYLEIEKRVKKDLIGQLLQYFDSFVQ